MKKYLRKLSELVLLELGRKNQSCVCFAELCGISRNEVSAIINQKKNDVRLSTIIKICENSDIQIENLFSDFETENTLNNAIIIIGGKRYIIKLKECR